MKIAIEIPTENKQERLDNMAHELAYEAVRQSPLFDSLERNATVDAKADELADHLSKFISSWIDQECGSSILLEHKPLVSLTEAA